MDTLLWLILLTSPVETNEQHYKYCSGTYPTIVLSKPSKQASWETPPDIRICPNLSIDPARVSRAMNYWEHLGHQFGNILIEKDMSKCHHTPFYLREIQITIPNSTLEEKYLAMTQISTHKATGEIAFATIHITKKISERPRVLEHELGHALGWLHYPQSRHIMNPDWDAGGYESYGLRK